MLTLMERVILLSGTGEVDAALQVRSDTVLPFAIGDLMSLLCQICFCFFLIYKDCSSWEVTVFFHKEIL